MDSSVGFPHTIVAEELHYRRVCARWIARCLTPEIQERRRDVSSVIFERCEQEGESFFKHIIIGDESYVHTGKQTH